MFGRNDLVQNAPISRIDLLVCRNSRTTFVVDEEGRIARVFQKVKSAGHGDEVAVALTQIR